jgi:outer membrane protein OmpA-like peptidoglycan-associated protein
MNYNLYRGGADTATEQRNISKINQEVQTMLESKRQALEGIEFSWNAHEMIQKQLVDLLEYRKYAEVTLDLFKDEFDMGRRSMLDILAAQNDLIGSRQQIINAQYDELFARYRILDAMGLMVVAVMGNETQYASRVNLGNGKADIINDVIPVKLDQDNDTIADNLDLCDNSKPNEKLMPYGCTKSKELILETPKLAPIVVVPMVEADSDKDGIVDTKDLCPGTPKGYTVDQDGCPIKLTLHINYAVASDIIPASSAGDIEELTKFMKANERYTIDINGHTDSQGNEDYNQVLSQKRSISLQKRLLDAGISPSRMKAVGLGESQPIASNIEAGGRAKNRRTEVIMHANRGENQ